MCETIVVEFIIVQCLLRPSPRVLLLVNRRRQRRESSCAAAHWFQFLAIYAYYPHDNQCLLFVDRNRRQFAKSLKYSHPVARSLFLSVIILYQRGRRRNSSTRGTTNSVPVPSTHPPKSNARRRTERATAESADKRITRKILRGIFLTFHFSFSFSSTSSSWSCCYSCWWCFPRLIIIWAFAKDTRVPCSICFLSPGFFLPP